MRIEATEEMEVAQRPILERGSAVRPHDVAVVHGESAHVDPGVSQDVMVEEPGHEVEPRLLVEHTGARLGDAAPRRPDVPPPQERARPLADREQPGVEGAGADNEPVEFDVFVRHGAVRRDHEAVLPGELAQPEEVPVDARVRVEVDDLAMPTVEEARHEGRLHRAGEALPLVHEGAPVKLGAVDPDVGRPDRVEGLSGPERALGVVRDQDDELGARVMLEERAGRDPGVGCVADRDHGAADHVSALRARRPQKSVSIQSIIERSSLPSRST